MQHACAPASYAAIMQLHAPQGACGLLYTGESYVVYNMRARAKHLSPIVDRLRARCALRRLIIAAVM